MYIYGNLNNMVISFLIRNGRNKINIAFEILKMSKRYLSDYDAFKQTLKSSKAVVVLSGAGISAESGIPVFRGEGGLWRNYRAESLATPVAFKANPNLVWEFYNYRRTVAANAKPNNAHLALHKYEESCGSQDFYIITQNVDGLHHRAGSRNVLELHGSLWKSICTNEKCRAVESVSVEMFITGGNVPDTETKELPKCKQCSALTRPYIVWFGENLDPDVLNKAHDIIGKCDLCLVVGTSSVVYPAAMFAPLVAERGMPVAEFNINKDPANDLFKFYFEGPCGTTLPKALGVTL